MCGQQKKNEKALSESLGQLDLDDSDLSSEEEVPFIKDRYEARGKASMGSSFSGSDEDDEEEDEDEEEAEGQDEKDSQSLDLSAFVTNYEVDPRDLHLGEVLGSGSYGKVYRAKLFGKDVAVKKLTTKLLDDKALKAFGQEVNIMWYFLSFLSAPNLIIS